MFSLSERSNGSHEPEAYLTLSVDDGHPTDFRTAEILSRLGLEATFYVPARNWEREVMSAAEVLELSKGFEIGAHTMNHRRVHRLNPAEAYAEIADGKKWLEDVLSKKVVSFCYPGGKNTAKTREIVANLGFIGARTCELNLHTPPADPFRWGVSAQAYSHGLVHSIRHNTLAGMLSHLRVSNFAFDWESRFTASLDWVEARGGIAHLYMHSWETDSLGQWRKLERVLANAAARRRLIPVSNGKLFSLWHKWRKLPAECAPNPTFR